MVPSRCESVVVIVSLCKQGLSSVPSSDSLKTSLDIDDYISPTFFTFTYIYIF